MTDLTALIARLEAWEEHDFHTDRQLSDEVLIADGWKCERDVGFEGGVRWFWGPLSASESTRPHPVNDLNTAIGVIPMLHNFRLVRIGGAFTAYVWPAGEIFRDEHVGCSSEGSIAILIAAMKAIRTLRFQDPSERDVKVPKIKRNKIGLVS